MAETARYIGCGFGNCSITGNSISVVCHIYYSANTVNLAFGAGAPVPYIGGGALCADCPFDRQTCINGLCSNCSSLNYEACVVKLFTTFILKMTYDTKQ